jgi:hypothetical protein
MFRKILLIIFPLLCNLPLSAQTSGYQLWRFDDLGAWKYVHQDDNPNKQVTIKNGVVCIYTRSNTFDRKKIHTREKVYTTGKYIWRTYISDLGEGDQTSIANFLYCDDHHELDFEVGYGKKAIRKELNAAPSEMIAYMTSQDFPFQSVPVKIKAGWHLFAIDLKLVNGLYTCSWLIDNVLMDSLSLNYGNAFKFYIYCSVENLKFIGDHPAKKDNYALFDFVKYRFHN